MNSTTPPTRTPSTLADLRVPCVTAAAVRAAIASGEDPYTVAALSSRPPATTKN